MAIENDPVENDTNGWVELDVTALKPEDMDQVPFRLVANRFKSSSPDSEAFIHDPLNALLQARAQVEALWPVEEDWRVTTFVINHHKTLSHVHVYAMGVVSPAEKTVGVTIYKQDPGGH